MNHRDTEARRGKAAMENSIFKIQDPSFQKTLPEKQQITISSHRESREQELESRAGSLRLSLAPSPQP